MIGPAITLRRAKATEAGPIKTCVANSLNATYGGLWTTEPLAPDDDGWDEAWVALSADRIVGVGLSVVDAVSDLWVLPEVQGQGAGSALLAAMEAEILARGFTTARLRCLESNQTSRAFYRSRGWREVRTYPHETIPLNTVDMRKALV